MLPVQSLIRPDVMPAVDLAEGSKDRTKPNAVQTSGPRAGSCKRRLGYYQF